MALGGVEGWRGGGVVPPCRAEMHPLRRSIRGLKPRERAFPHERSEGARETPARCPPTIGEVRAVGRVHVRGSRGRSSASGGTCQRRVLSPARHEPVGSVRRWRRGRPRDGTRTKRWVASGANVCDSVAPMAGNPAAPNAVVTYKVWAGFPGKLVDLAGGFPTGTSGLSGWYRVEGSGLSGWVLGGRMEASTARSWLHKVLSVGSPPGDRGCAKYM